MNRYVERIILDGEVQRWSDKPKGFPSRKKLSWSRDSAPSDLLHVWDGPIYWFGTGSNLFMYETARPMNYWFGIDPNRQFVGPETEPVLWLRAELIFFQFYLMYVVADGSSTPGMTPHWDDRRGQAPTPPAWPTAEMTEHGGWSDEDENPENLDPGGPRWISR